jgi:hypothetical protein
MNTRSCPVHRVPLAEGGLCPFCVPARQNSIPTRRPPGQPPSDRATGSYEPVPRRKSSLSQLQRVDPDPVDAETLETPQAPPPRPQSPTSASGAYRLFEAGGAPTDAESSARFARGLPEEDTFTEPLLIDESSLHDNRPPRRVQSAGGPPPILPDESSPPPDNHDTDADLDEGCATDPAGSPSETIPELDEALEETTPVDHPKGLASYREALRESEKTGAPPPKRPMSGTQLKTKPGSGDSGTGTS